MLSSCRRTFGFVYFAPMAIPVFGVGRAAGVDRGCSCSAGCPGFEAAAAGGDDFDPARVVLVLLGIRCTKSFISLVNTQRLHIHPYPHR